MKTDELIREIEAQQARAIAELGPSPDAVEELAREIEAQQARAIAELG